MTNRHYEIERTMTTPSAGGTVTPTTTGESSRAYKDPDDDDDDGDNDGCESSVVGRVSESRTESKPVQRKRRRADPAAPRTGIPRKTPRWTGEKQMPEGPQDERASEEDVAEDEFQGDVENESTNISSLGGASASGDKSGGENVGDSGENDKTECSNEAQTRVDDDNVDEKYNSDEEDVEEKGNSSNDGFLERETETLTRKPPIHPDVPRRRLMMGLTGRNRRDDSARLRKTIQWLEEGARKLREDLAEARAELHEERRASRLARREIEVAVREARATETAKHQRVIAELKTRLSQSPSRSTMEPSPGSTKAEFLKDENHRREISAAKKRLAEADATIRKLRSNSLDSVTGSGSGKRRKVEALSNSELRKLDGEIKALRAANKKLEDKLNMACTEAEKIRTMELRIQHENHESELNALKKSLRSDTIRMMDEIKNKDREIERLGRLARENRKSRSKDDDTMRKLRENENGHQIRLAARIEDKIPQVENVIDLCKGECEAVAEVERLRELAVEQQEFIEVLRQAVKEKERKLDQLSNKKRKEEFYKQWLELEPVAEVDDEEEHEEGDSALSSAPSSLSPQPGGCGQWQNNAVTREAYEAVLLEIDEIQTKFIEEQQELAHAKSQVRDLEKALLQETRGSQNSRRALSEKLRKIEEREAGLLAEISELREQNELLEFRVLELEETPGSRETPDTADSGIVSPEPINIFKQEQNNKQRDRAVATVLPFSSYTHPTSPIPVKKPPLSLQESGIFEDDEEETDEEMEAENNRDIELTSCGTQTEAPVGELLQEVQRLQELRERIQERAVKVPSNPAMDSGESKLEEDKSLYREKIRELEERLAEREEEDAKRVEKDFVAKQREEDLLDENYRLTERVYWLENELRRVESEEKTLVDVETMTEPKDPMIDVETMTEVIRSSANVETMTEHEKHTSNVETMTQLRFPAKYIRDESAEVDGKSCLASVDFSPISRCEKIYRTALQENLSDGEESKTSRMEINGVRIQRKLREPRTDRDNVEECNECLSLRRDYDEKIQQLAKAELRFRGRLVDLERKEGAFVHTLKQVDVTWSQLEADHAKKLEEIGRRLEEKVECNRRILERVAELEMTKSREDEKKHCSCKCSATSLTYDGISSSITSADVQQGMREVDSDAVDETEAPMDVDVEDRDEEMKKAMKIMREVNRTTQTEENGLECPNCRTKNERTCEKKSKSLRRSSANELPKNVTNMPTVDAPTEMAVEAKEEIDVSSTTITEADCGVSRVHLLPEEERPTPEPAETLRVTVNETELDKKVRDSEREVDERVDGEGAGWVTKNWKTESYDVKGGSVRAHETDAKRYTIFRHDGLLYVIYPEICV